MSRQEKQQATGKEEKKDTSLELPTSPLLLQTYLTQEEMRYPIERIDGEWISRYPNKEAWFTLSEWMIQVTAEVAEFTIKGLQRQAKQKYKGKEDGGEKKKEYEDKMWLGFYQEIRKKAKEMEMSFYQNEEEMSDWRQTLTDQFAIHSLGLLLLYLKKSKIEISRENLQLLATAAMLVIECQWGDLGANWAYDSINYNVKIDRNLKEGVNYFDKKITAFEQSKMKLVQQLEGKVAKLIELLAEEDSLCSPVAIIVIKGAIEDEITELEEALAKRGQDAELREVLVKLQKLRIALKKENPNNLIQLITEIKELMANIKLGLKRNYALAICYAPFSEYCYTPSAILKAAAGITIADTSTIIYQHSYSWMVHFLECLKTKSGIKGQQLQQLKQQVMTLLKASLTCLDMARQKPLHLSVAVLFFFSNDQLSLKQLHECIKQYIPPAAFSPDIIKPLQQQVLDFLNNKRYFKELVEALPELTTIKNKLKLLDVKSLQQLLQASQAVHIQTGSAEQKTSASSQGSVKKTKKRPFSAVQSKPAQEESPQIKAISSKSTEKDLLPVVGFFSGRPNQQAQPIEPQSVLSAATSENGPPKKRARIAAPAQPQA